MGESGIVASTSVDGTDRQTAQVAVTHRLRCQPARLFNRRDYGRGMRHGEFLHPRLVAVYDAAFPWSREDDFFVTLVEEVPSGRVLDLGCGTGRLAVGLAAAGHRVTGVDPAAASLRAARAKPGADRVTWIEGTSRVLPEDAFDVAVMTSHVAQFFLSDEDWQEVLRDLNRALASGGRLVFDTRDPRARHWERWNPAESRRRVVLADGSVVLMWSEVTDLADDLVTSCQHYAFADGKELFSVVTLRWRSEAEVTSSLQETGFSVERVYGGWRGEPVTNGDGELIVVARKEKPRAGRGLSGGRTSALPPR